MSRNSRIRATRSTNAKPREQPGGRDAAPWSDATFRSLLDAAPDAMLVVNAAGEIVIGNKQAIGMFGYSREQLIGTRVEALIPERLCSQHAGHRADFFASPRARPMGTSLELAALRADGTEFPVEISLGPLETAAGTLVTAAIRDISQRKQAENAFREQAATLKSQAELLELAHDAIFVLDMQRRITFWNRGAEEVYGWRRDEALGCTPDELLDTQFAQPRATIEELLLRDGHWEGELIHKTRDRRQINVASRWALQKDDAGVPVAVLEINRDITARKLAEEGMRRLNDDLLRRGAELEASNKELEAFSYSVSHDLRAPLRHIAGYAQLLVEEQGPVLPPEAQRHLGYIQDGTRQMGQLIDELLDLARIGRQSLRMQVSSLKSLAEEVRQQLSKQSPNRNIEWRIGELPYLACDAGLLKQVFVNLLSNAVKFTGPRDPAVIEVGVSPNGGQAAIFVRDNGVGFNMKYAGKLFGIFQRLHRAEDFEGTGIGLATVQRIIRKHGGRVWADSEMDKGATFYFTLGAAEKETAEPRAVTEETE
jgi:PAS domain S-box-containing protein